MDIFKGNKRSKMYGMEYSHRNSEVLRNKLCYRSKSITKDIVAMSTKLSMKKNYTYLDNKINEA